MNKDKGYIVTHTHWDREWRYPLWENRMKLVDLMDELLGILESNKDYKAFMLDGQSVMVEDYLEVRPEQKDKIIDYVKEGRMLIGPWYSLPDLYPIDGECLIRNLLRGIRYSDSLGGHLKVAYESFGWGQTAQFPQIYKGFGLDTVIVGKNVSKERAPESEFIWEGPDGSKVLATRLGQHARANFFMNAYIDIMYGKPYLSDEYKYDWGNMGAIYHQADEENHHTDYVKLQYTEKMHEERIKDAIDLAWEATNDTNVKDHRVLMDGSDSTTPQPMITDVINKANEIYEDKEFIHSTLEEYTDKLIEVLDFDQLKIVKGELRDGPACSCSANALATRPELKILNKRVQNSLLRSAEPLSVIGTMIGMDYDTNFIDIAERYMLLSHAHDSINGVTQDKTVDDVKYMLNQALEISEVINNKACKQLVKQIDTKDFDSKDILLMAVNPLGRNRRETVKVYIDIPREEQIWDFDIQDNLGNILEKQVISRKEEVVPVDDMHSRPWPFYIDRYCIYMDTGVIPAGGYKVYKVVPKTHFNRKALFWPEMRKSKGNEIACSTNTMENKYLRVKVEPNGTISIINKETGKSFTNLNYFEDTGDCGDYWIYYPPYNNKTFTSLGSEARIWVEDNGPLSSTIVSEVIMKLPAYSYRPDNGVMGDSKRSEEEKDICITSYYTLKKDSNKVDIKVKINNTAFDHRLRVMFDTGIDTDYSYAAGHFTVDKRPITPLKDKNGEYYPEMQTLPMQNFIGLSNDNDGLAVINNCLSEYQVMDNQEKTIAITLFRSVRNIICTEFRSAGVFSHQMGGQSQGVLEYEYGIYVHEDSFENSDVFDIADRFNVPVRLVQTCKHSGGYLPLEKSFYMIEPSQLVMSAFKKAEDRNSFIIRIYNPTNNIVEGKISINMDSVVKEGYITNLNEERENRIEITEENNVHVSVAGNKIQTIELVLGGNNE
ncbi:alpha-mannosidase [Vallitalea guaymasensis]|uniref:alpha-mannosidase n=1 Tax=Vallitalea guaymasensis TaxID=1185412 RepID=UPI00272DB550|nr:glycoside hydrolase family 38 C-terminal domain-containing protein [Vallitalea guaymasensis]